jgi:Flp pilus assembly pilin Flp
MHFYRQSLRFFINQSNFWEGLAVESIWRFIREESGITAADYGIVLGCIAGVLIIGIVAFYTELAAIFNNWSTWFGAHNQPGAAS